MSAFITKSHASVIFAMGMTILGLTGCNGSRHHQADAPTGAVATDQKSGNRTASRLGDLTPFHAIATDVAKLVDQGNLAAAKTRIKDLEIAWDAAEAGLKPRASEDWHVLDKAIDKALSAVRADPPVQADCQAAMQNLLNQFKVMEGQSK